MIPQTSLEFNYLLFKIKENLCAKNTHDYRLNQNFKILDAMLKNISTTTNQEETTFYNLMMKLKDTETPVTQKLAIIDGAFLFLRDFCGIDRKYILEVTDIVHKNKYLKMLEAAYPEFNNKEIEKKDTNNYLNTVKCYLLSCDGIIKKFRDVNLLKFQL